jgi:hypothetical protein
VTRSRSARRAARTSSVLVALGLAATAAPQALAAEGGAPPLPDATELAAAALAQAGLADALPTLPVEQPVAQPLDLPLEPPAATAQQAAEEPANGAGAAPPPQPVAVPAPEAAPQPDAPPSPAPAPQPIPQPAPEPAVVQQEPANVNVSIRVESPGDDGAVTQANAAAAAEEPPQYRPEAPQYRPAEPDAAPAAAAPAAGDEPTWEWSWTWSCADVPTGPVPVPAGAATQVWIWNWNWNCGGDGAQTPDNRPESPQGYRPATVQYRPVNINVSIRVNSPGNNGPVVQTNVAVAVSVPPLPTPPVPALAQPPAAPPAAPPPAEAAVAPPMPPSEPAGVPEELDDCCLLPEPRGLAFAAERPAGPLAGGDAPTATGTAALPGDTVAVAARLELQLQERRRPSAAAEPPRPQLRPAPRVPPRRAVHDEPTLALQSGLGLSPLGAPDRSLPFAALVLVAFLFASAGSSLASARSRPTPGADADDPPDRPG